MYRYVNSEHDLLDLSNFPMTCVYRDSPHSYVLFYMNQLYHFLLYLGTGEPALEEWYPQKTQVAGCNVL